MSSTERPIPRLLPPPGGDWGLEVENIDTLDWQTLRPAPGGLFCERIFGPLRDWQCACGELAGEQHAGETCPRCGVEIASSQVRKHRYAHVRLTRPVCQLFSFLGSPSPLVQRLRLPDEAVRDLVYLRQMLDPETGRLVPRDEAGSGVLTGGAAVRWLLERAGCDPAELVIDRVPVLPAGLREVHLLPDGKVRYHDVNAHYQRVINRNFRVRKLSELNAPFPLLVHEQQLLQQAVDALTDNARAPVPFFGANDRPLHSLADLLNPN